MSESCGGDVIMLVLHAMMFLLLSDLVDTIRATLQYQVSDGCAACGPLDVDN